jgi:hypothetical protein
MGYMMDFEDYLALVSVLCFVAVALHMLGG